MVREGQSAAAASASAAKNYAHSLASRFATWSTSPAKTPQSKPADESQSTSVRKRDSIVEKVDATLRSQACECTLILIVAFNIYLVILETDADGLEKDVEPWVHVALTTLVIIYSLELGLRFFVSRWEFFYDRWNVMDLIVVAMDVTLLLLRSVEYPKLSILRMGRFVKLARAYKMLMKFPELHLMMQGLASALRSMFWGLVLIIVVLLVWSILAVQIIHPLNQIVAGSGAYEGCDRCPRAFETVFQSFLTFTQQIVAGDSWGAVSVPIIEEYPLAGVYFLSVLVSIQLVILNLILASICDAAQAAREGTLHDQAQEKMKIYNEAKQSLLELFQQLDTDDSGVLTLQEFETGVENNQTFQDMMRVLDIQNSELPVVLKMLDADESGDVDYAEFVEELWRLKSTDTQTLLVFIRFYVCEIRKTLEEQVLKSNCELQPMRSSRRNSVSDVEGSRVSRRKSSKQSVASGASTPSTSGVHESPGHVSVDQQIEALFKNATQALADIAVKYDQTKIAFESMRDSVLFFADANYTTTEPSSVMPCRVDSFAVSHPIGHEGPPNSTPRAGNLGLCAMSLPPPRATPLKRSSPGDRIMPASPKPWAHGEFAELQTADHRT